MKFGEAKMGRLIKVLVDRSRDRSCAGGIARFECFVANILWCS